MASKAAAGPAEGLSEEAAAARADFLLSQLSDDELEDEVFEDAAPQPTTAHRIQTIAYVERVDEHEFRDATDDHHDMEMMRRARERAPIFFPNPTSSEKVEEEREDSLVNEMQVLRILENPEVGGPENMLRPRRSARGSSENTVSLQRAFEDCEVAMQIFFNNDVEGAMNIMEPWSHISLYHSLGTAIFLFIPAVLTFDPVQITRAQAAIKQCLSICNKYRKQFSIVASLGSLIKKPNFSSYTDNEAHAELCFAEALLLQAALTVIQGEDLAAFIKGTLKVKTCFDAYQVCWEIKESKKKFESTESRRHFKSGVRLGTAAFNLMISLLPPKIVSLLEFVGFSGNKYYGLLELEKGSRAGGLRAVLCSLTLLVYHLVVCQFTGGQGDLLAGERLLKDALKKYPKSVWFLMLHARLHYMLGRLCEAAKCYRQALLTPNSFAQFKSLCNWELMWITGLMGEWRVAAGCADKLLDSSSWSRASHTYIKAALMMQLADQITACEERIIEDLMQRAPELKSRIAGKSLPMEKFVVKRCARYRAQGNRLLLPMYELFCIWNLLPVLAKDQNAIHRIISLVGRAWRQLEREGREWMGPFEADNRALLMYIEGCCYSALNLPLLAIDKLSPIFKLRRDIKEDSFLLPYATCELAVCYYQLTNLETSRSLLIEAKKKYSGYSLESRLLFRLHARMDMIKSLAGNGSLSPEKQYVDEFERM